MVIHGRALERKQAFLFRSVDVSMELFAMAATCSHARRLADLGRPDAGQVLDLADLFCRTSRRRVQRLFRDLWHNDDRRMNQLTASLIDSEHASLSAGRLPLGVAHADDRRVVRAQAG